MNTQIKEKRKLKLRGGGGGRSERMGRRRLGRIN